MNNIDYITKEEFEEWKSLGTTRKIWRNLQRVVNENYAELGRTCGKDQLSDRFRSGMLAGIEEVLQIDKMLEWEEKEGTNDNSGGRA